MYSINFRLRYDKSIVNHYRTVNVRLKVKGEYVTFGTSIKVPVNAWVQKTQTVKGYAVELVAYRSALSQVRHDLINLILMNPKHSARQISDLYCKPDVLVKTKYLLIETYQLFIKEKKEILDGTHLELAKNTKQRWYNCKEHLLEFVGNDDIEIDVVDIDFGNRLYLYLIKKKQRNAKAKLIGHDYAVRNLTYLNEVLNFAKRKGFIKANIMDIEDYKRNPPKDVESLTQKQLTDLSEMRFKGTVEDARVVFMAMAYSGINHCDLHTLEKLRNTDVITHKIERQKNEGKVIEKAIVPIFPELRKLLETYNYKLPYHDVNVINRHLHIFESLLEVDIKITTYTARKTAAMLLSERGVSIDVISKILGHTSIITTQRHYVKLSQKRVEDETRHLHNNLT